jgi:hypothetical protein
MADCPAWAEMIDAQKLAFSAKVSGDVSWTMRDLRADIQRLREKSEQTELGRHSATN